MGKIQFSFGIQITRINRPVPGYQQNAIDYWKIYPSYFQDLFVRSFTGRIKIPPKRITEREWQVACLRLYDSTTNCPDRKCDTENFYFEEGQLCWSCKKPLPRPAQLMIGKEKIVLNKQTKLSQHHAKGDFCVDTIIGEVVQKPDDPTQWGIKNLSTEVWTFIGPNGQSEIVGNGRSIPLIKGGKINFGKNVGDNSLIIQGGTMPTLPGGELAHRPLYFFWIADCSGSMQGEKIGTLNYAIKDSDSIDERCG